MSSHWDQITPIIQIIMELKPRGILDIGPGRGKYGVLFSEYLREWAEQDVTVDAIADEPIWCRHAYHEVWRGDAREILPRISKNYHLITMIDVIEHMPREDGAKLLSEARKHVVEDSPSKRRRMLQSALITSQSGRPAWLRKQLMRNQFAFRTRARGLCS